MFIGGGDLAFFRSTFYEFLEGVFKLYFLFHFFNAFSFLFFVFFIFLFLFLFFFLFQFFNYILPTV